ESLYAWPAAESVFCAEGVGLLAGGELEPVRCPLVGRRERVDRSRGARPVEPQHAGPTARAVHKLHLVAGLGIEEPQVEAKPAGTLGDGAEVAVDIGLRRLPAPILDKQATGAGHVDVLGAADVDLALDRAVAPQRQPGHVDGA